MRAVVAALCGGAASLLVVACVAGAVPLTLGEDGRALWSGASSTCHVFTSAYVVPLRARLAAFAHRVVT